MLLQRSLYVGYLSRRGGAALRVDDYVEGSNSNHQEYKHDFINKLGYCPNNVHDIYIVYITHNCRPNQQCRGSLNNGDRISYTYQRRLKVIQQCRPNRRSRRRHHRPPPLRNPLLVLLAPPQTRTSLQHRQHAPLCIIPVSPRTENNITHETKSQSIRSQHFPTQYVLTNYSLRPQHNQNANTNQTQTPSPPQQQAPTQTQPSPPQTAGASVYPASRIQVHPKPQPSHQG